MAGQCEFPVAYNTHVASPREGRIETRQHLLAGLLMMLFSNCAPYPPIVASYYDDVSTHRVFRNYVAARYPIGSDAATLEAELRAQGFAIAADGERRTASLQFERFCRQYVTVAWSVSRAGSIESLSAGMNHCAGP
jgi:hypothetical protein